jgi:hypothetical protein
MNKIALVEVVSVEDSGYYSGGNVSGSTVNVTLQRGSDFASCDQILFWEECSQEELNDVFDEWVDLAIGGEEGYSAMITEGMETKMYSQ